MMAGIISIYYKNPQDSKPIKGKLYFGVQLLPLLVSVLAIFYSFTLVKSEVNVQKLLKAMHANNQKSMIFYANKAFSKFTTVDYYAMPIHTYKGMANINMKKYKQANQDLQIALGYFPDQIAVLSNLAIVSAELNQSEKAKSYLEQSLKLYPNYDPSLYNLINVYYREKDYQQAYLTLMHCNTKDRRSNYNDYLRILKNLIDKPAN
jgi:tetratricopeptide (TPR) repeat protein